MDKPIELKLRTAYCVHVHTDWSNLRVNMGVHVEHIFAAYTLVDLV